LSQARGNGERKAAAAENKSVRVRGEAEASLGTHVHAPALCSRLSVAVRFSIRRRMAARERVEKARYEVARVDCLRRQRERLMAGRGESQICARMARSDRKRCEIKSDKHVACVAGYANKLFSDGRYEIMSRERIMRNGEMLRDVTLS